MDDDSREGEGVLICRRTSYCGSRNGKSTFCIHPFAQIEGSWQEQIVERYSGQIGSASEGKGYIHATHQEMSKFSSRLETGYQRVVDVVEDFVVEATKAIESKRLPRSIPATG